MREKPSIVMLLLFGAMILVVILFVWMALPSSDEMIVVNNFEMVTEEYAGMYTIYLDIADADIKISASPDDILRLTFPDQLALVREYDAEASHLEIRNIASSVPILPFGHTETEYQIELTVPEFLWIQITAHDGSIQIKDINASSLNVFTYSGTIEIEQIDVIEYIVLGSNSGYVNGSNFYSQSVKVNTDSGDVHLEHVYAKNVSLNTVSGGQSLGCEMGAYVELISQSGHIDLNCQEPIEGMARTSSGNVSVTMPAAPQSVAFLTETGATHFIADDIEMSAESSHPASIGQVYENLPTGPMIRVETLSGNLSLH